MEDELVSPTPLIPKILVLDLKRPTKYGETEVIVTGSASRHVAVRSKPNPHAQFDHDIILDRHTKNDELSNDWSGESWFRHGQDL